MRLLIALTATVLLIAATPPHANAPTPQCVCVNTNNQFPTTVIGFGGLTQGTCTESLACTADYPTLSCTVSGTITWTPAVACSPTGEWAINNRSYHEDQSAGVQYLVNCNAGGATETTTHSVVMVCRSQPMQDATTLRAVIRNSGGATLGNPGKRYECILQ
jgi:hypothetical protein